MTMVRETEHDRTLANGAATTARSYLGRVTKDRIAALKKTEMAAAAVQLVAGTGWLQSLLRTAPIEGDTPAVASCAVAAE
jgi:ParB family chromosome partitioning protein